MAEDTVRQAREALERGDADGGRALLDRVFAEHPEHPEVRDLYASLHLAHSIRLAAGAREARRQDIVRRDIPYDEEFQDGPEVSKAFDEALAAVDRVLEAVPSHEKALMMKASILFRRDRAKGRAGALSILRAVADSHPENRQAAFAIKKIERPCPRCSDTGFCPDCRGRGTKRFLGTERTCGSCHGQGICLLCGVV